MWDRSTIKSLVNKNGLKKLIAIYFDNAGREFLSKPIAEGKLTNIDQIFVDDNIMQFEHIDMSGAPYIIYKSVDEIQGMVFAKDAKDIPNMYMRDIII